MKKILNSFILTMFALITFSACSDVPAPYEINYGNEGGGSTTGDDYYINETFAKSLGNFVSQSESGELAWKNDFSCAMITGYDKNASPANKAGITYLVSPAINLAESQNAYITFDHAINYERGDISANNQLVISQNYSGDVKTATWEALTINTQGTNTSFTFVNSGKVAIPTDFIGKSNVTVALKHTCTSTSSSTWEVKNFKVVEGAASTTPGEPVEPGNEDGSETNPYTATQAIAKQDNSTAWVKGYIVGCVKNGVTKFENPSDALFTNFDSSTNVFIADNADETDYTKCLNVKLNDKDINPADMRNKLNLVDNQNNKGKELMIKGVLRSTFTTLPGIRDITEFKFEGSGTTPEEPGGNTILSETFANGFGSFTPQNVSGDQQAWQEDTSYGYVKMSAFSNGNSVENEDWLISPAIDLSKASTLTFEHVFGPAGKSMDNASQLYTAWISTDYAGNVTTATWQQINLTYPSVSGWKPFFSVEVSLPAFSNNSRLAFKYKNAEGDETLTWEIKNVVIK